MGAKHRFVGVKWEVFAVKIKKNKGYSLVELIVVMAVIAVLVGLLAPQLIKYIEKSKAAVDQQLLNRVYVAITYATEDPNVVQDHASMVEIDNLKNGPVRLDSIDDTTLFGQEVLDTLGWTSFAQSQYLDELRSGHTANSYIYVQYKGTADNPLAMWITYTDMTGNKDLTVGNLTATGPTAWHQLWTAPYDKLISIK